MKKRNNEFQFILFCATFLQIIPQIAMSDTESASSKMDTKLDIESLDKLFKPSDWTKRSTPERVISEHIVFTKRESDRARDTIPFEVIQYGNKFTKETFDIYGIDLPKDAPIFVFVHGGYWHLDIGKETSAYMVEPLYKAGLKVIVLDYDLCPNVTLEQLVDQVQRASISIIEYGLSMGTKCIQLAGHSAGAHLVTFMFNKLIEQTPPMTSILKSLHLISGIYDVYEAQSHPTVNPNNVLALNVNNVLRLSPILLDLNKWTAAVSGGNATPTHIHLYVGSNDAPKLIGQAYCMASLLNWYQYPSSDLILLQNIDHFDIVENLAKPDYTMIQRIILEATKN